MPQSRAHTLTSVWEWEETENTTDHLAVIGLIHHDISVHAKPTHFHFTQSQEGIEFIPWKHLFCYKYSCYWMINLIFQEKLLLPINNHMLYVLWEERARSINRKKSDSKSEDRNNWFWCNCFPGSCAGLLKSRLHESSLQIAPQEKNNTGQCETEQEVTCVNLQRNFVTLPRSQRRIIYSLRIVRGEHSVFVFASANMIVPTNQTRWA